MMRPYIIAVYAYLSVAQLAMAVSISNMYDQNRMMHNAKEVKSDGTQEEHDSKPGAQEMVRAKKDKVDTSRNPGDAPLKQAEVMLEISADGNVRVQQKSDTHDNDVDGNEKKNKERKRDTEKGKKPKKNSLVGKILGAGQGDEPEYDCGGGKSTPCELGSQPSPDWDTIEHCCDKDRDGVCVPKGKGRVKLRKRRMSCDNAKSQGYCACHVKWFLGKIKSRGCEKEVRKDMEKHCKAACGFDRHGKKWPNCKYADASPRRPLSERFPHTHSSPTPAYNPASSPTPAYNPAIFPSW